MLCDLSNCVSFALDTANPQPMAIALFYSDCKLKEEKETIKIKIKMKFLKFACGPTRCWRIAADGTAFAMFEDT